MKKLYILIFSIVVVFNSLISVKANSLKVIDEANVLNEAQIENINQKINEYINKTGFDIVVYFTEYNDYFNQYSTDDEAITNLADDTYDFNDYGIGEDRNGLIMVVDVGYRKYTITTCGEECIDTYTGYSLDNMYGNIGYYLSNDDWANASLEFISQAKYVYENRIIVPQEEESPYKKALLPSAIGALLISIIVFFILRGQLKHMKISTEASGYMNQQNINLLRSGDIFLYTDVKRHRIQRDNPNISHGGSSTHISSSGTSHGGGGSHSF